MDGTDALAGCLKRGDLVACGFTHHITAFGGMSPIGPWPLLQYVPDLVSTSLGVTTHPDRVRILALLGLGVLMISMLLAWVALSRAGHAGWFWGFLLVALSGPMLAYANTSWGELLASGLLVCFVAVTLVQAPPAVIALAAFAAGLTKETVYPFVAVLGLLGLVLARRRTGRPIRRHVAWGASGLVLAIVLASLFNVLRYGSVLNTNQLQPEFHTPGIGRTFEFALGLLVSPNGGMFFFWLSASVLLSLACLLPLFRSRYGLDRRPALVLIAVVLALTFGLASWWSPFGWQAWGPRLTIPWILPLVLIATAYYGEPIGQLARRLLAQPWRLLLVAAVLVAVTLPHVGYLSRPQATIATFFSPTDRRCHGSYGIGSSRYYACLHEQMWTRHPMLLDAVPGLKTTTGAVTSVAVTLGVLGCLILLRQGLQLGGTVGDERTRVRMAGSCRCENQRRRHSVLTDPPGSRSAWSS